LLAWEWVVACNVSESKITVIKLHHSLTAAKTLKRERSASKAGKQPGGKRLAVRATRCNQ